MAKYKAYAEYKDSGVEWLGEIPGHWDVFTGKRIFQSVRTPALKNDEQLAASQKFGVIPQSLMMQLNDSKVMLALKGTDSFRHVDENNFVISLRSFEGGIEHSKYSGCVSPAYTVLKNTKPLSYSYYRYLLKCAPFIAALQSSTDSLRDGKSINYEQFGAICLPITSVFEQNLIAAFLDHETAKIDNLIEKQQQLIELLKEKRQAVISHAVTKGLNPDVPMKDSGVEWLGEVPAHWTVTRLGYHAIKIGSGKTPRGGSEIYLDEGVLFLRSQNIYDDGLRVGSSECVFIDLKTHNEMKGTRVLEGDILLNITGGSIGRSCIVPTPFIEANVNQHVCILRFRENIREFISYAMKSSSTKEQIEACQVGGNREGLNFEQTSKINICLPPEEEIGAVLEYLKIRLPQLDTLEKNASNIILLLQERRTALISAAVTGKIDVRDWVAPDASDIEISQEAIA